MSLHWNEQVTALANAAAGLQETADAWYDDLPRFLVPTGQLTGRQYPDTVIARNAAAWQHLLVVMECVPAMLPQVLAAARRQDYRSGPISEDLGQLTGLNNRVGAIVRVREEWLNVQALMNAAHPGAVSGWPGRSTRCATRRHGATPPPSPIRPRHWPAPPTTSATASTPSAKRRTCGVTPP